MLYKYPEDIRLNGAIRDLQNAGFAPNMKYRIPFASEGEYLVDLCDTDKYMFSKTSAL